MNFYQIPLIAILFTIGVLGLIVSDAETGDAADSFANFNYGDTLLIAWAVNRSSLYNIYLVSCPGITSSSPGAQLGCTTNNSTAAMSLFNSSTCYNLKNENTTVLASSQCNYTLTDDSNYGNATAVLEGDFNSLGSTLITAQIQAEFIADESSITFKGVSLLFAFEWDPPVSASSSNLAAITSVPTSIVSSTTTTSKGSALSATPTLPPTTNSLTTKTNLSPSTTSSPSSVKGPSSDSISFLSTPASWYITATSSIIEESSTSTADSAASSNDGISLSTATTAGIITGVSVGALALAALLFFLRRWRQHNAMEKSNGMGVSGGVELTTGNDIQEVSGVEKSSGPMPAELDGRQVLRT